MLRAKTLGLIGLMNRYVDVRWLAIIRRAAMALMCSMVVSTSWGISVDFAPISSSVSGPPYPTGALTALTVVTDAAGPLTVDQLSISIGNLNPLGATDWFVADVFASGVEREMKESGEKGGTEDINIGVGELQECSIHFETDFPLGTMQDADATGDGPMTLIFEAISPLGAVAYTSSFTTPQPATFTSISVTPGLDGRSFDLTFSLLYNADYDPDLSILNEVMTGDFTPVPEPSSAVLLILASVGVCLWGRAKALRASKLFSE